MKSDQELKIGLAMVLPDVVEVCNCVFYNVGKVSQGAFEQTRETEWLHVCWLVEELLKDSDHLKFRFYLREITRTDPSKRFQEDRKYSSASWQQRAEALLKVLTK